MPAHVGQAQCIRETEKAVQVELESYPEKSPLWIPKSVIHEDSDVYDAQKHATGELVLQTWWAEQEGLA